MIAMGQTFMSRKSSRDEKAGLRNEPNLRNFAATKLKDVIVDGALYTTGFVRSLLYDVQYAGFSPDALCLLTEQYGNVGCYVEFKTSKNLHPNMFEASHVKCVEAGSSEYLSAVPREFRVQLLHGIAVLGLNHALLIRSALHGVHSTTLIHHSDELIAQYLALLRDESVACCYRWLHLSALQAMPDDQIVAQMPLETPQEWRRMIASWVPAIAAVLRYRMRLGKPIAPTKFASTL
jgi:hypothetical protein